MADVKTTEGEQDQLKPEAPSNEENSIDGKKIIARNIKGTVKWFNVKNGFGFINRDDTGDDIFVHQTAVARNNPNKYLRSLGDGEKVEFDVVEGQKGPEAANVTGPNGGVVEGSKYAGNIRDGRGARGYRRRYYYGNRSGRRGPRATSEGDAQAGEGEGEDIGGRRRGRGGYRGRRGYGYRGRGRGRGGQRRSASEGEQQEGAVEGENNFGGRGRGRGRGRGGRGRRGGRTEKTQNETSENGAEKPQENVEANNGTNNGKVEEPAPQKEKSPNEASA